MTQNNNYPETENLFQMATTNGQLGLLTQVKVLRVSLDQGKLTSTNYNQGHDQNLIKGTDYTLYDLYTSLSEILAFNIWPKAMEHDTEDTLQILEESVDALTLLPGPTIRQG